MKSFIICVTIVTMLFVSLSVMASPLDDKIATLKKAIADEIASRPSPPSSNGQFAPGYGDPRMVSAELAQLVDQANNPGMSANIESQINQILAAFSSDSVKKAGQDLIGEIQAERKARADAAAVEVQSLLKRVSDQITQATKPEDLDALLIELQQFQGNRNGGYGQENQAIYQQVSSAFEFTKVWQNYLSHKATGQTQLATSDLQNLSQNNSFVGIIPRSHILELMVPTATPGSTSPAAAPMTVNDTAKALLTNLKSLDEMEPTLEKIEVLRHASNQGEIFPDTTILKQLIAVYEGAKVGLPVDIGLNVKYYTSNGVSPELQQQLSMYIFQKYFATYKGTPAGADENPSLFVDRVSADAVSRQDWTLLKQTLNVKEYLEENASLRYFNTRTSTTAISSMLTGINQEEAGQYMLAVVSYQDALKGLPDNTVPPKFIGDKLATIQKDHPKEYDQGMQMVTTPPVRPMYLVNPPGKTSGSPSYQGSFTPPSLTPVSTNPPPTNPIPPSPSEPGK